MCRDDVVVQGQPLHKASKALILLHGRGGTALNMIDLAHEICDDTFYLAAPQAPNHSWYPNRFMADEKSNEPWLSASIDAVKGLIDQIAKEIPRDQIFLLGFSQGACLALEVSARFPAKYGGVMAFSGGLIGSTLHVTKYRGDFKGTAIFIGNSDRDAHVPLRRSEESKELLEAMGAHVTLKIYSGMGHLINEDELNWARQLMST